MRDILDVIPGLIAVAIVVLLIIGWIMCLVAFCNCDFTGATSSKAEVIYGIGVFTGLGSILGWFNFGR